MKRTLFPTHAIFHKALVTISFIILSASYSIAQAPAKWSVIGNTAVSGDFLGTTNNEDLVFKTNNTTCLLYTSDAADE